MKAMVYDTTKSVLEDYPETRSNMFMLYAMVMKRMGYPTDISKLIYSKAPSFESIARARRKIVEDFPNLKADEGVETERINKQADYIRFALEGELEI